MSNIKVLDSFGKLIGQLQVIAVPTARESTQRTMDYVTIMF